MEKVYVYAVMDDEGFTHSLHKTEEGAKKERDKRIRNGQTVGAYKIELFE